MDVGKRQRECGYDEMEELKIEGREKKLKEGEVKEREECYRMEEFKIEKGREKGKRRKIYKPWKNERKKLWNRRWGERQRI